MLASARFDGQALQTSRLGRYRLIGEIAQGGMGIVYLAVVTGPGGFNKLFAVKELKRELALEQDAVTPFLREAKLAAKLSHPNVVQTFEVGSQDGRPYLAMEYLEGESFAYIQRRGKELGQPIPLELGLAVLTSLLDGLHNAHTLADFSGAPSGIVHRDVSPQNVLVTFEGQTKVLDFGIAKALDSAPLTQAGMPKGKLRYMSPEQALGDSVDARTDVFAVGVMLTELLCAGRMWPAGHSNTEILKALAAGQVPSVDALAPQADAVLRRIASKAMSVGRAERYQSAAAMRDDLDAFLASVPDQARSARALGSYVSRLLSDERQATRAMIAERLRQCEQEPTVTDVPVVKMSASGAVQISASEATATREYLAVTQNPTPAAPPDVPQRPRRARWVVPALGILLASSVGIWRLWPQSTTTNAAPSASGATATPSPIVDISIAAQPSGARLTLGGRSLRNPDVVHLSRSPEPLLLRVEADGFETQELPVVPDRERSLVLALVPSSAPPAASASASSAPAPATPLRRAAAPRPAAKRPPGDLEPF
jgi:eukaryotic-like serine/threonine-protein kinase